MVGLTRYVDLQELHQFAWFTLSWVERDLHEMCWVVWIVLSRIGFICMAIGREKKDVVTAADL